MPTSCSTPTPRGGHAGVIQAAEVVVVVVVVVDVTRRAGEGKGNGSKTAMKR
jgi:hypothetical protein